MHQTSSIATRNIAILMSWRWALVVVILLLANFIQPLMVQALVNRCCPKLPLDGSLLRASDSEVIGNDVIVPNGHLNQSPARIQEADVRSTSGDNRKPHYTYFAEGKQGRWGLVLYSPIRWIDAAGLEYEFEEPTTGWKSWLDAFAAKAVQAYSDSKEMPENVIAEVTLQNDKPVPGLVFKADNKEKNDPITQIVEEASGLTGNNDLTKVLPTEAKDVEVVLLKLHFFKVNDAG